MSIWWNVQLIDEYFLPREKPSRYIILWRKNVWIPYRVWSEFLPSCIYVIIPLNKEVLVGSSRNAWYSWLPAVLPNLSYSFYPAPWWNWSKSQGFHHSYLRRSHPLTALTKTQSPLINMSTPVSGLKFSNLHWKWTFLPFPSSAAPGWPL